MNKFTLLTMGVLLASSISVQAPSIPTVSKASARVQNVVENPSIEIERVYFQKPRVYINVELTGYCDCYYCTQNGDGTTALGTKTSSRTIAVPPIIDLGSEVYLNDQLRIAEDRGGAIMIKEDGTYIFDIWQESHEKALQFGRKYGRMYLMNGKYYIEY